MSWQLTLVVGCKEKNTFVPPPPPKVTVAEPVQKPVTDYLDFTGNTQAIYTVQLPARVEGYLVGVHFQDGADVKKGDLLFTIQPEQYQAQLQQAEADVLNQKAALEHAETEFQRYSRLFQQKAAPQTEVDRWKYERDSARAGLLNAEAQVELAKLNVRLHSDYRAVRRADGAASEGSRQSGRERRRRNGPRRDQPDRPDLRLLHHQRARSAAGEKAAAGDGRRLIIGLRRCRPLSALPTKMATRTRAGSTSRRSRVDPSTGTLLLRAIVPNKDRLMVPGLFVRVRVPIARQANAILVPEVALGTDQIGRYVLIVNDKNVVERRGVKLGQLDGTMRVIDEGLTGQERVVVNGLMRAIPGREVSPEVEQAANPPAAASTLVGG